MNPNELERLLQRLEDGVATPEEQARVEAFLSDVEQEGLLAEALRAEAGAVDLVDDVDAFTTDAWMSAMLDHELSPEAHRLATRRLMDENLGPRLTGLAEVGHAVRDTVPSEAGEVDLWAGVAQAIGVERPEEVPGWDGALLVEAVRAEAGTVDVADEVVRRVRRSALAPVAAPLATGANRPSRSWFGVLALAAAVVLAVFVGRSALQGPGSDAVAWDVQFASAEEIAITDLSYDEKTDVFVFQGEGDNAPLIIWVDDSEEVTL